MKIKLAGVLRFAGRLIVAAPVIAEALGPVFAKRRRSKREDQGPVHPPAAEPARTRPPGAEAGA